MEINIFNKKVAFAEKQIISLLGKNDSKIFEAMDVIYNTAKETGNIYYLKENYRSMLFNINIKEDIKFYLGDFEDQELFEVLKSFNLDITILEKCYLDLSVSEIRKILLVIGLMSNSKIVILYNPTLGLDNKSKQTLVKHLKKIKRNDKTIIISSYDTNFLLEICDRVIVIDANKIVEDGSKFEIFSNEKILNKINLSLPNVLHFINKVKQLKNIKLSYRDNLNDLIKDIFRHAK